VFYIDKLGPKYLRRQAEYVRSVPKCQLNFGSGSAFLDFVRKFRRWVKVGPARNPAKAGLPGVGRVQEMVFWLSSGKKRPRKAPGYDSKPPILKTLRRKGPPAHG